MERDTETILVLAAQTLRFATNHPYAATGMVGAVVGSAVTYKVMTVMQKPVNKVFTPKVYKLDLPYADLHRLMQDPSAEFRWDMPELSVIVAAEQSEVVKELPVIVVEAE